ncbi:hypothetical protein B0H17DRAFT_1062933 [Mycena rosella]|uniref:Tat pathway signal sequence n=1 Tax=Mycena rosella TaxID=1033263 RepID=A0AAD7DHL8_MYCRO|nr:hypothetical protein B0H17DRAFT_1062933 [Mycena rosella]
MLLRGTSPRQRAEIQTTCTFNLMPSNPSSFHIASTGMSKSPEYHPLISDPSEEFDDVSLPVKPVWTSKFSPSVFIGLLAAETAVLAIALFFIFSRAPHGIVTVPLDSHRVLYSPALEAVEHEVRVYTVGLPGLGIMSPYQIPSSPALDEMWSDLYNSGISKITKEEATRLPNKTHAIPGDDSNYVVTLDVFHSLHCLNKIRMALDPDYYPDWRTSTNRNSSTPVRKATEHISHCVDWLRQSLMCAGDTSTIVWQWNDSRNRTEATMATAHTCRKFDKLQEWAEERMLKIDYDETVHIEDDIVIPIFHNEI